MIDRIHGDQLDLIPLRAPRLIAIQLVKLRCLECSNLFQVYTMVYQSTYTNTLNLYIFFDSSQSFKIEYKQLFYDIHVINFHIISYYNTDFLIYSLSFHIYDLLPYSISVLWHIIQK